MSLSRKVAGALAVAASLLVAALFALPAVLDGEALAGLARDRTRSSLQRELEIGDVRLRLFPRPTIKIAYLALSNPSWASRAHLLEAQGLSASVEWTPLLRGRLVVSALSAQKLQLNLETDQHGRNGWDFPATQKSTLEFNRVRHAEFDTATLWRRMGNEPPDEWQLTQLAASAEPGWKKLDLKTSILGRGETLQLALKLADASAVGEAGASTDGEAIVEFKGARLQASGQLPLCTDLQNYAFKAQLQASSLAAAQAFLGRDTPLPVAPLELQASLRRQQEAHVIEQLDMKLGRQTFSGQGRLVHRQGRWQLQGQAQAQRLDWAQALLDLGNAPVAKKPDGELLPTRRLPWATLTKLMEIDADVDTRIGTLVTRTGLELKQWRSRLKLANSGITLSDTHFQLMGGTASARVQLAPQRSEMQVQLQLQHLLLEEWFRHRSRRGAMVGNGPMDLNVDLRSRGQSWKELGANLNGPVSINIGALTVHSPRAREAKAMLVNLLPAFSEEKAEEVRVQCLASDLRFVNGRAQSRQAVGVRSQASKLLLGGDIDLRRQSANLSGRVRAAEGVTLGIATLAGDVRIGGPLVKPQVSVEPVGVLARLGAAIATSGLSVLATAAYDAATGNEDPCVIAGGTHAAKVKPAPRARARTADTR